MILMIIISQNNKIIKVIQKEGMDPQEYEEFMRSIRQTQQSSKRALQSIDATLGSVKTTLKDIEDTKTNIKSIQDTYGNIMDKLAAQLAMSMSLVAPFKKEQGKQYEHLPVRAPMKEAVAAMMKCQSKEILFVTGAGVSVKSGISTFRGDDGLYSKNFKFKDRELTPEEFINLMFFSMHPEEVWNWIDELSTLTNAAKPNQIHQLIHQCLLQLSKKGKNPVLVTQNIDDLHIEPKNKEYQYHKIHGSVNQMRCSNMHMKKYDRRLRSQACEICSYRLRPHIMFFDESYGPQFGGQVKDRVFDFVVVIGTSLNTGLCIKLVSQGKQIIQINPNPVIEIGQVYQYSDQTEKTLKEMLQQIRKS